MKPFAFQFGNGSKRGKIAKLITDTRNYLTHYDMKLANKAAAGRNLWVLCLKMEALLQLHLLKTLSFTDEQIAAISSESLAFRQKLDLEFGSA